MPAKILRRLTAVALTTLAFGLTAAEAATDIHGKWSFSTSAGTLSIVDVAQTGNAVSFTYDGLLFAGTLSDAGRLLVEGSGGNGVLDGDVAADGTLLNAS